jgi:hypothetical protein
MDLIRLIRLQAGKVKGEGSTSVTISSLESLLSEAEKHLSTAAAIDPSVVLEHAKMQHASDLAEYSDYPDQLFREWHFRKPCGNGNSGSSLKSP